MSLWVSARVIGTFLFLIFAFFFILTWDPILKVIDLGAGLAQASAWMSYGVLRGLGALRGFDVQRMGTIMSSGWFFVKLVALLIVTYLLWAPLAPYYAQFLLRASRVGVWLTEFSTDPQWQHPTQLLIKPEISPTALLFFDTRVTQVASGIPAEWVMANMGLLLPLLLATPARTW